MADPFDSWSLDREIVLVKVINHPRHRVFAAWMDPNALAQWYGPAGLAIESIEADIREGGVWRFDMVGMFEGREQRFPNLMRFLEIVPNERIVYTWNWRNNPTMASWNSERVVVQFADEAGGTRLTIQHEGFETEKVRASHEFGWKGCCDKLITYLEQHG